MVTGKDMLVDKLFELLYERAGGMNVRFLTYRDFMEALKCAKSPTLKNALKCAVESGVLHSDYQYIDGRMQKVFWVTKEAINAALQDVEDSHATALPF